MKLEPALPSRDLTDGRLKVVVFTSGPLIPVNSVFLERLSKDPLLDLRGIIVDEYRGPRKNLAQRVLKSLREERLPWLAFKLRSRLEALVERLALRFFEALHPRVSPRESYEAFEKSTGVPVYRVADIHSEQSLKLIRSLAPQLGVILGGRILRDTVISIPEKNAKQIVWLRLGRLCVHLWFRSFFWFATSARRGIRGSTNYHELNSQLPIARAGSGKLCGELVLAYSFPLTLLSRFMHMTR